MSAFARSYLPPRLVDLASRALLSVAIWAALAGTAPGQGAQSAPPPPYFLQFPMFYDGQYVATEQSMLLFLQSGIKNPAAGGLWIDSICFEAMRGECCFQMGNHAMAYLHFESALRLLINFSDWMLSVQFPPAIVAAPPQNLVAVPWYATMRPTLIGGFSPTYNILQGRINNNQAVFQGGLVQQAVLMPLYVQEIVRCSCLAIRRWRELLGPSCPHSETTRQLVTALGQRPAWPNHWSEAWVDAQLGLAYAAAGQDAQARKTLQSAERAIGFDHPLTGTVLLELGRLDMAAGDYKSAQKNFLEASWSAANFSNFIVVEEALRYGAQVHQMTTSNQPYLPLAAATTWAAAQGLVQLNASLLLSGAENLLTMNQAAAASALLTQATAMTFRTDLPRGKLGARLNHLKALASYQLGLAEVGDVALAAAMMFQTGGSLWLYHIGLVDVLWLANEINERTAVDLYANVLRDPAPRDWLTDPLEALTVMSVPHALSYENWFDAAVVRKNKEHERALEIADMVRRHRFLTTLEHGGRLVNLRWLLEAPLRALDAGAIMQRQGILGRYPEYEKRSRQAKKLRADLQNLPLAPDDQEVAKQQSELLAELATITNQQEVLLRVISVRREPGNLVFPPLRTFQQVQESLAEGQSLLAFFTTHRFNYAFLVGKDKYAYWELKPSPKKFQSDVGSLLRLWGNFEQNKVLKLDDLTDKWRKPAQGILSALVTSSKSDFTKTLDELVIVPDGMLWYIPFEALPVSEGDEAELLINKVRIRYAPTVGLAVGDSRRRKSGGNMAVVLGRLYPREDEDTQDIAFDDLARALPKATPLRDKLPASGPVFSSLFDRLIVLSEIAPAAPDFNWSPWHTDVKSHGGTLGQWIKLPFNGPDQVILPGFRTPAERALSKSSLDLAGNDLFLATCGLMASGARTVLISRWRTGGQTSVDLVREFAQELPHTTASAAWQRSVQLVSSMEVNPAAEPRLKLTVKQAAPKADFPFFWAGYLLADTGARPSSSEDEDEEKEEAKQILAAMKALDKPANAGAAGAGAGAGPAAAGMNANEMAAGDKAGEQGDMKQAAAPNADRPAAGGGAAEMPDVQRARPAVPPPAEVADGPPGKRAAKTKPARVPRADRKKPAGKSKKSPAAA